MQLFLQINNFSSNSRSGQPGTKWKVSITKHEAHSETWEKYSGAQMLSLFRNWRQDELHTDKKGVPLHSSVACHPLWLEIVWKNDSFSSRTIGLDIQWHCAMPVWSPGKAKSTDMRGFPLTVSRHQAHQTSLGIFQKAITKSYSNLTSTQMSGETIWIPIFRNLYNQPVC